MKKILVVLLVVIFAGFSVIGFAKTQSKNMSSQAKTFSQCLEAIYATQKKGTLNVNLKKMPTVSIMYVNKAKTQWDRDIDQQMLSVLAENISLDKYQYLDGMPFMAKLYQMGIEDLTTTERVDILNAFKGKDVDYIVFCQVDEFTRKDTLTVFTIGKVMTANVHFKIIDVANNKYLYNGKFVEQGKTSKLAGGVGNKRTGFKALQIVSDKIAEIIKTRLPLEK